MAFSQGQSTDLDDFFTDLNTFVTANGWTNDELVLASNRVAFHRSSVYIQLVHDDNSIAIFQSLGFTGGQVPGDHPDDSGNGDTSGAIDSERRVSDVGTGPFTNHYFFADTTPAPYVHVVLEFSPGQFRHMSFGELEKEGDWTGGEYAAGHQWESTFSITDNRHYFLFDNTHTAESDIGATVHCESLPDQAGASKWGHCTHGTVGTDDGGNARVRLRGDFRGGIHGNAFGLMPANPSNAHIVMHPINVYYQNETPSPDHLIKLGSVPNMRFANVKNIVDAAEHAQGGDTWKFFPWVRKSTDTGISRSNNMGIAYKKT